MEEALARYHEKDFAQFRCLDGRFRLLCELGAGRFGRVFLARDCATGKLTAVKELRDPSVPGRLEDFLSEIATLVFVCNADPHIALTRLQEFKIECGEQGPVAYYTMDFVELGELFTFLEEGPPLSEEAARHFFGQLVENVAALHRLGVAHLDLKPENILVDERGNVVLCDVGNAGRAGAAPDSTTFVGSDEYSAPEAFLIDAARALPKDLSADWDIRRLDSFSLGVVLFVMLYKSNPFASARAHDQYYQLLLSSPAKFWGIFASVRKTTPAARELLERLLLSTPQDRPLAQEVLADPWLLGFDHAPADSEWRAHLKHFRAKFEARHLENIESKLKRPFPDKPAPKTKPKPLADLQEVFRRFLRLHEKKILALQTSLLARKDDSDTSSDDSGPK